MLVEMQRGLLGLVAVRSEASKQVDEKINGAAVTRV
jgi:hypothetical protein